MDLQKTLKSMTNIKPDQDKIEKIESIRNAYKEVVKNLYVNCIDSRELSIAITRLEESLMWTVKSIILEDTENFNVL